MKQWYALYTKANAEEQVSLILQEQSIETYLPTLKTKKNQQEPFFPCYLFMKADLGELSSTAWQWTPGLRRMVCQDELPLPVSPKIITTIKDSIKQLNKEVSAKANHQFQPGEKVRIVDGPFKDKLATFSSAMTSSERVRVLLNVLGQQKRVQIDVKNLELVSYCSDLQEQQPKRRRRTRGKGRRIKYQS